MDNSPLMRLPTMKKKSSLAKQPGQHINVIFFEDFDGKDEELKMNRFRSPDLKRKVTITKQFRRMGRSLHPVFDARRTSNPFDQSQILNSDISEEVFEAGDLNRMTNKVKQLQDEIAKLKEENEKQQAVIREIRVGYYKELINVQSYSYKLEAELNNLKNLQEMDTNPFGLSPFQLGVKQSLLKEDDHIIRKVHFFDGTHEIERELTPELKMLLNGKIDSIQKECNEKLKNLKDLNDKQYQQIMKYKVLNESSFNFDEMTAVKMIEKLFIITSNPEEIWDAFEHYQPSFFEQVLLDKFQIGSNYSKKIVSDYHYEVSNYKREADEKVADFIDTFNQQKRDHQKQMQEAYGHLRHMRLELGSKVEFLQDKVTAKLEEMITEALVEIRHDHTLHMEDIVDENRLLKNLMAEHKTSESQAAEIKLKQEKISQIDVEAKEIEAMIEEAKLKFEDEQTRGITSTDDGREAKMKERLSEIQDERDHLQFEVDDFLKIRRLQSNWGEIEKMSEEIYSLKEERSDWIRQFQFSELRFKKEICFSKKFEDMYRDVLRENEALQQQLTALRDQVMADKLDRKSIQEEEQKRHSTACYISMLEEEIQAFEKFLKVQRMHNPAMAGCKLNPAAQIKKDAAKMRYKEKDELKALQKKNIRSDQYHIQTQTDLFDLKYDISMKKHHEERIAELDKTTFDIGIQATVKMVDGGNSRQDFRDVPKIDQGQMTFMTGEDIQDLEEDLKDCKDNLADSTKRIAALEKEIVETKAIAAKAVTAATKSQSQSPPKGLMKKGKTMKQLIARDSSEGGAPGKRAGTFHAQRNSKSFKTSKSSKNLSSSLQFKKQRTTKNLLLASQGKSEKSSQRPRQASPSVEEILEEPSSTVIGNIDSHPLSVSSVKKVSVGFKMKNDEEEDDLEEDEESASPKSGGAKEDRFEGSSKFDKMVPSSFKTHVQIDEGHPCEEDEDFDRVAEDDLEANLNLEKRSDVDSEGSNTLQKKRIIQHRPKIKNKIAKPSKKKQPQLPPAPNPEQLNLLKISKRRRMFEVKPYGINSLQTFLEHKISKYSKKTQATQTYEAELLALNQPLAPTVLQDKQSKVSSEVVSVDNRPTGRPAADDSKTLSDTRFDNQPTAHASGSCSSGVAPKIGNRVLPDQKRFSQPYNYANSSMDDLHFSKIVKPAGRSRSPFNRPMSSQYQTRRRLKNLIEPPTEQQISVANQDLSDYLASQALFAQQVAAQQQHALLMMNPDGTIPSSIQSFSFDKQQVLQRQIASLQMQYDKLLEEAKKEEDSPQPRANTVETEELVPPPPQNPKETTQLTRTANSGGGSIISGLKSQNEEPEVHVIKHQEKLNTESSDPKGEVVILDSSAAPENLLHAEHLSEKQSQIDLDNYIQDLDRKEPIQLEDQSRSKESSQIRVPGDMELEREMNEFTQLLSKDVHNQKQVKLNKASFPESVGGVHSSSQVKIKNPSLFNNQNVIRKNKELQGLKILKKSIGTRDSERPLGNQLRAAQQIQIFNKRNTQTVFSQHHPQGILKQAAPPSETTAALSGDGSTFSKIDVRGHKYKPSESAQMMAPSVSEKLLRPQERKDPLQVMVSNPQTIDPNKSSIAHLSEQLQEQLLQLQAQNMFLLGSIATPYSSNPPVGQQPRVNFSSQADGPVMPQPLPNFQKREDKPFVVKKPSSQGRNRVLSASTSGYGSRKMSGGRSRAYHHGGGTYQQIPPSASQTSMSGAVYFDSKKGSGRGILQTSNSALMVGPATLNSGAKKKSLFEQKSASCLQPSVTGKQDQSTSVYSEKGSRRQLNIPTASDKVSEDHLFDDEIKKQYQTQLGTIESRNGGRMFYGGYKLDGKNPNQSKEFITSSSVKQVKISTKTSIRRKSSSSFLK